jgi:hypothetical protein
LEEPVTVLLANHLHDFQSTRLKIEQNSSFEETTIMSEIKFSDESREAVTQALLIQGEFLSDNPEDSAFHLDMEFHQCVGYVTTALFRLKQCEARLLPKDRELTGLEKEIRTLLNILIMRLVLITKKNGFTPTENAIDHLMFSFPGGFISSRYGRVGTLTPRHRERYAEWLRKQKESDIKCDVCQKKIYCLCPFEGGLPPKQKTCFVGKHYPCINILADEPVHICTPACSDKFENRLFESGLRKATLGNYTLTYDPNGISEDEAMNRLRAIAEVK